MDCAHIVRSLLLIIYWSVTDTAVITTPPSSITAPLYTVVNFYCQGTGDTISWILDGGSITDTIKQQREISINSTSNGGTLTSILTIRALPINNGISVGCRIITLTPFSFLTRGANLYVTGVVEVSNLYINFTSLYVTWSPSIFPQNAVITYIVYVMNQHGSLLHNTTIATTDTYFYLSNLTLCDIYTVIVTASTSQYTSLSVNTTNQYASERYSISIVEKQIISDNSKTNITFAITVKALLGICSGVLLVKTINLANNKTTIHSQLMNGSITEAMVNYTANELSLYSNYLFTAYIADLVGHKSDVILTTYHVQEVNISIHNDSVVVECIFVDISTADGCHIIFTDSSQGINESFNITKPNSTESIIKEYITLSVSGNYTVKAYDIVNGIIIDTPSVVYPNIVQYVSLSLAPSSTTATANSTSIVLDVFLSFVEGNVASQTLLPTQLQMPLDSSIIANTTLLTTKRDSLLLALAVSIGPSIGLVCITSALIFIVVAVICIYRCQLQKRNNQEIPVVIENPAYGRIESLQRGRVQVTTKTNPSYEQVIFSYY